MFFSPQYVRELPEFAYLMSLDRSRWPRCLLWHGWLRGLRGIDQQDPWALSFGDLASFHHERCLGAYPVDFGGAWSPPDYWDAADIALEMPEHPNVWTDGSREDFTSMGGFEVAGAGVYLLASEVAFDRSVWGTAEEYGDARLERCRAFLPVPGVMQTVQRAEFWGAIVALQAYWPFHSGIDNVNVARTIGRLLDEGCLVKPLPLVKDGDLIALVQKMISSRGRETVRVTKVKGHAEDAEEDQLPCEYTSAFTIVLLKCSLDLRLVHCLGTSFAPCTVRFTCILIRIISCLLTSITVLMLESSFFNLVFNLSMLFRLSLP